MAKGDSRRVGAIALGVVALLTATAARAEKQLDGGQVHQGFALELDLGSRLFTIAGVGETVSVGALQGGIFFGYKISRVIVGLGFNIARVATGASGPGADTSTADTSVIFAPGVRVAIVRSSDQKVELYGEFDLGLGTTIHEENPNPTGPQPSTFLLTYQIGPGVRYWVHPQFAIAALAGVEGNFTFNSITQDNVTTKTSQGLTSIFAALQFTGVF